ncbi:DUF488 domain-containing protein [Mycobacterium sp.]|uniref:DUF488 domain-containing protein n=1 Tax=Mycobacterium sp. TaxID=1785 RepID=UPI003A891A82
MGGRITYCRVYDHAAHPGEAHILVDRVWPRGIKKADLQLTEWLRDIAPSTELRKWYSHDPEKFAEFRRRYLAELASLDHREAVEHLRDLAGDRDVVLMTASRDVDRSQAAVLAHWLSEPSGG